MNMSYFIKKKKKTVEQYISGFHFAFEEIGNLIHC